MLENKRLRKVAKLSHLKENKGLSCDLDEELSIALFLKENKIFAINNHCPHKMALLSEGSLEGNSIVCPWHCWKFDITNGKCLSGQDAKVKTYEVVIKGDDVFILL